MVLVCFLFCCASIHCCSFESLLPGRCLLPLDRGHVGAACAGGGDVSAPRPTGAGSCDAADAPGHLNSCNYLSADKGGRGEAEGPRFRIKY